MAKAKKADVDLTPREYAKKHGMWPKNTYCEETANEICLRVSTGEPLRPICREPGMPSWDVFYKWVNSRPELEQRFAHARALGYDAIAAETLEIADDGTNDWMEKLDAESKPIGWQLNGEHVQRSKLRIETRLKLLAKWDPKRYGERLQLEANVELTSEQIDNKLALLMAKAQADGQD